MSKPLSAEALKALNDCTVSGNVIKLGAQQLDYGVYLEVKAAFKRIGGVWKGNKVWGFVFEYDPSDLLADLQGGTRRDIKKEFQFFETPDTLAKRLVQLAEIDSPDLLVIEPSAGRGAIVKAILAHEPSLCVHGYELMPQNREHLQKIEDFILLDEDFLNNNTSHLCVDRIIANPPFSNNQDIDHIYEMYRRLLPKGILVSVASIHWHFSSDTTSFVFNKWLAEVKAEIIKLPAETFKESGTNVITCIIKIRKP